VSTWREHRYCIYAAVRSMACQPADFAHISLQVWSPQKANIFASASGDMMVKVWDTNCMKAVDLAQLSFCSSPIHHDDSRAQVRNPHVRLGQVE
jgi:hypothetical protein